MSPFHTAVKFWLSSQWTIYWLTIRDERLGCSVGNEHVSACLTWKISETLILLPSSLSFSDSQYSARGQHSNSVPQMITLLLNLVIRDEYKWSFIILRNFGNVITSICSGSLLKTATKQCKRISGLNMQKILQHCVKPEVLQLRLPETVYFALMFGFYGRTVFIISISFFSSGV